MRIGRFSKADLLGVDLRKPMDRSCLGCDRDFTAFGRFNRLCPRCRRQVGDLAGSRFTEGGEYT